MNNAARAHEALRDATKEATLVEDKAFAAKVYLVKAIVYALLDIADAVTSLRGH